VLISDDKNWAQKSEVTAVRQKKNREATKPKRQKMAANEQQATEESATEPILSEIRKILIDIQSTNSIILSKNSNLAAKLPELKMPLSHKRKN